MENPRKEHQGMPLDIVRRKAVNDLNEMIFDGHIKLQKNHECFCGSQDFTRLSRLDRYGLPFGTQICRSCGLISQTTSISEESLGIFYDEIYWPLNHGDAKNNSYATDIGALEFSKFITPEIRKRFRKAIKIMEIGCGQGDKLSYLRRELEIDYDVTALGCDYSSEAILAAKRNGIDVSQGGIEVLLDKGPADVVILSHVFEHVVDLRKFLDQIEEISYEGTLVYVEVPGVIDLKNKPEYEYDYQDYCVVAHIHNFSLSTLVNVFASRNFFALKGTEFVRLIVSKSGDKLELASPNPYSEIIEALSLADEKHVKWLAKYKNPVRKYLVNIAKAVLGRI
jgi:SAM-dependent methyltransferase